MIDITLKTFRKPKYLTQYKYQSPAPPVADLKVKKETIFDESDRRDMIIKEMAKNIAYKEGDSVIITSEAGRNKYGLDVVVERIMQSYVQYGKNEEWPKDDNPMIVTCYSRDKDIRFFCTPAYVGKK